MQAMNPEQVASLRDMLTRFVLVSDSADAARHAEHVLNFLRQDENPWPWSRATLAGHLTASAWVLDSTCTHAALIHHRKLTRWLQPGGHVEDDDASWCAAAQREVTEETGITQFNEQPDAGELFDVDVHPIPARKDEPAHVHYDLRFLFVADVDATQLRALHGNSDEVRDCRWFALAALANDATTERSLRRMIALSLRRVAAADSIRCIK